MNDFQIALAAGVAVLLIIAVIGARGATRDRKAAPDSSGDASITTADSSSSDCGSGDGGGGCD